MKRLLTTGLFLIVLTFLSITEIQAQTDLTGTWERRGDDLEGMQIKVTKTKSGNFRGKIVALPITVTDYCSRIGEIKWRNIVNSREGLFQMDELMRNPFDCSTTSESRYINVTSEGKISITPVFNEPAVFNNFQTWVKISD